MAGQDAVKNTKTDDNNKVTNTKKRWKRSDKGRAYGGIGNSLPPEEKSTAYERSKKGIIKYLREKTVQLPVCFPPETLMEFSAACKGLGITQASIIKPEMLNTIERAAQAAQGIQTEMLQFSEQVVKTKRDCLALYNNVPADESADSEYLPDARHLPSKAQQFSVCLPKDLYVQFSAACKGFGVTQQSVVCSILYATVGLLHDADGAPVQIPPFNVIAENTKEGFVEMYRVNTEEDPLFKDDKGMTEE